MVPLATFLILVLVSILVTRVAAVALIHTGLTKESARFQARSAFTGTGFTTKESEMVVNHPVRRRIVMVLILLGNAGLVTAISTFILTFVQGGDSSRPVIRLAVLAGGLLVLWGFASSKWVDRWLSRIIDRLLRRYTELNVTDYASLLHLAGDYRLAELKVTDDDWLAGKTLAETKLRDEGINVLGVERPDGTYVGSPRGHTGLAEGDVVIVYGSIDAIKKLDMRKKGAPGDTEHQQAVQGQQTVLEREAREEPESPEAGKERPQDG
ncbi:MAG: TrkA C-terminal domain-containing protein [Thermoleophilia bacterium]|nr:TrkA C-terminal domain-containing protein [Thermoleophilia bacterium]